MPLADQGSRPPSMADVAAVAGVSHQTVSRVLNDSNSVRPDTRDRVVQAISQLGYRRNETARALVTRRSKLLGVITLNFVDYGPATTLLSVQLAANKEGYLVSVATLAEFTADSLRRALDQFLGQGVAGIVVIAPVAQMARELEDFPLPVPTIAIASSWASTESAIVRVGVDQRGGIYDAMQRLSEQGCQSIAHFGGPEDWFDASEREAAWRESLEKLGLTAGPFMRGDWSASRGYAMAQELLQGPLPDAVLVANDQMSLGALRAFAEAGVHLPEDLRLVGYDDEAGAAYFYPSLTTIRQDFSRLGSAAVDALIRSLNGEQVASMMIAAELQVRATA